MMMWVNTIISLEVDTVWIIIRRKCIWVILFLFSEHFSILFNEFKLNKLMQDIQYTVYL